MTTNRRTRPSRLAALVLAVCLAGCADGSDQSRSDDSRENGTPTMSPSVPPSESPSGTPSPSFSPSPLPPTGKPGSSVTTVRGTIREGVEAGCLMLAANGAQYQLVGGDRRLLRPGRTVEVAGELQPDLLTTCQQGTPLVVKQARLV